MATARTKAPVRETRYMTYGEVSSADRCEAREKRAENGKTVVQISGISSRFNTWYEVFSWFGRMQERVDPKAFDKTLKENSDRLGMFNHDPSYVLGRTSAGTMRDFTDGKGLHYEIDADPDSPNSKTAIVAVERGDVRGASIAFETVRDSVEYDREKKLVKRTLLEVKLFEHGPVTTPASPTTTAEIEKDFAASEQDLRSVAIKLQLGMPLTRADTGILSDADPEQFLEILQGFAPLREQQEHPNPATQQLQAPVDPELLLRRLSLMRQSVQV